MDGWYVDLTDGCYADERATLSVMGFIPFGSNDLTVDDVRTSRTGKPESGFAIEMVETLSEAGRDFVTHTRLITIDDAPLADAVFEVPPDYQPVARAFFEAAMDPTLPNTFGNRVRLSWRYLMGRLGGR